MKKSQITALGVLLASCNLASASEALTLSFQRTGTDLESVAITADISGVSAELTSFSHTIKDVNSEIICADVNGSASPTIVYDFTITGLPSAWTFNNVGLDIHALNSSGGDQYNNDSKIRQFNVSVTSDGSSLVSYTDLDPAAGITGVRKVWDAQTAATVTPDDPFHLTITVTKGTENVGCFFGLQGITLSTVESEVTPEPEPEPDPEPSTGNKVYGIKWKNNTSSYITEQGDGSLAIGDYSVFNKVFWEFIPTENEDCYYIRSTASGKYIGSCNMTPSSASRLSMSDTPVEYYVQLSSSTSGENVGCYWLSSTDCANYNSETSGARCLNKDGASTYVITWSTGLTNYGSYWSLVELEDEYEPQPFSTGVKTLILNTSGNALNHDMTWSAANLIDENQQWLFIGESNAAGGYQIYNASTNEPLNDGAQYRVEATEGSYPYKFVDSEGEYLTLGGEQEFMFATARSSFAVSHQIYQLPCGSSSDTWISQVTIGDDYHYPMATKTSSNTLNYGSITSNPGKYVMLSLDAATVNPATEVNMTVSLNKAPSEKCQLILFVDWNRDGIFETSQALASEQTQTVTLAVPEDAKLGRTRLRLRLSTNGLNGADDDVIGEILDLMLNVAEPSADVVAPEVTVNDPTRGTAEWHNGIASAEVTGNALFLYWTEGKRIVSVDSQFEVAASHTPRKLTAILSANTEVLELDGIEPALLNKVDTQAEIIIADKTLSVTGADSKLLMLFGLNGQCLAQTSAQTLDVAALPAGIYVAKAVTTDGVVSATIKL